MTTLDTTTAPALKTCTKCGATKPATDFSSDKRVRSGLEAQCKDCVAEANRAWRAANKERADETMRAWRADNKERMDETQRAWYAANKARKTETNKAKLNQRKDAP